MKRLSCSLFCLAFWAVSLTAAEIRTGTLLELRLQQQVTSYSSRPGSEVRATLIAPVRVNGDTLLPMGSTVRGKLSEVKRIGWGLRNLRASLRIDFDSIQLPDGTSHDLKTRLTAVDNAREKVDDSGKIVGIRATAPMGYRAAGIARNLFFWDPMIQVVLAGTTAVVLNFPEAEINFPAGTEMQARLTEPLDVDTTWSTPLPKLATTEDSRRQILNQIRAMTWRTQTKGSAKPADIVNLVFLGDPEWLERAFNAAGWAAADRLSKSTGWKTFHSFAEARPYPSAPMSPMTLDENPASLQFSKSLNNYSRRHHLRVFNQANHWNGHPVLAASSTQDLAITVSFSNRRLIHVIDRNIDNERAKIVNDLVYTGCVDAAEIIHRPWVPNSSEVATGEHILTDGAVAVLELNPCRNPYRTLPAQDPMAVSGGWWQRLGRQVVLTIGNDFTFNNPIYQAGKGAQFLVRRAFKKDYQAPPVRASLLPVPERQTDLSPVTLPDD
ncbi:MAG: LssY C-terminal domain-containing protein [Acidobacteria bacterium]|nr:LssY C-terminal domain-containing protein [Acidobacteriota bacterium]